MAQKGIVEQALLQVTQLEEAVKANAKGILASTMKQELNDLLKEQEDEDPEEEEKDVTDEPVDDETSISDEPTADDEAPEGEELPAVDDESGEEEPEMELPAEDEDSEDVLDMTGASEEEVLKVFKAMKPEDGIVVKREGNSVSFEDDGNEYIIKLDDESGETPGEEDVEDSEELPDELPDELAEQTEPTGNDEIVYEIELDDEDEESNEIQADESENAPFEEKPKKGSKKMEAKESVTVHKSHTPKDGQPFDKSSPQKGVKKLQANEESFVGDAKRPGTAPQGTSNPETKEPGKGQVKTSDGRPGTGVKSMDTPKKFDDLGKGTAKTSTRPTPVKGMGKPVTKEPKEQAECAECGDKKIEATEGSRTKADAFGKRAEESRTGLPSKKVHYAGSTTIHTPAELREEVKVLRNQNNEYKKALVLFKDKLNEVAVFNASLAYATRLFTEHSTTRPEKLNILKRFDTVSTITESKNLYETIKGELETKKPISEAAVEKIASTLASSATEMLSESKAYENPQFKRMKELMRKIK
jgi:hypothetical protein